MSDTLIEEQNQVFQSPPKQEMSNVARQSGHEIPVEIVTLPSRGLVYEPQHPLHRAVEIQIRSMAAKDEDLLTSQALLKKGTVLSKLLEACILDKILDTDSMVTGDRNAVLTALRITGYGPDYEVKIQCPDCEEEFENTFDLSKIPIKFLDTDPVEVGVNMFTFNLPTSKRMVHFKLLTGADELALMRMARGKKKSGSQIDTGITSRLQQSVLSICGEGDPQKLAYIIQNMSASDSRALRNHIDKVEPGLKMIQEIICPMCDELSEVRVPLGLTFFWPDSSR